MWSTIGFLLCVVLCCNQGFGSEIPDVTTIYEVKTVNEETTDSQLFRGPDMSHDRYSIKAGRVHARTNAIGLGIINENYEPIESKVQEIPNITCDANFYYKGFCTNWDLTQGVNWEWYDDLPLMTKPVAKGVTHYLGFEKKITVDVHKLQQADIFFTQATLMTEYETIYFVVRLDGPPNYGVQFFHRCQINYGGSYYVELKNQNKDSISNYCSYRSPSFQFPYPKSYLNVEVREGHIKAYQSNDENNVLWDWNFHRDYITDHKINYFSISSTRDDVDVSSITYSERFKAFYPTGEIIDSYVFSPHSENLCLAILFHCLNECHSSSFDINVKGLLPDDTFLLDSIADIENGWNTRVIKRKLRSLNPIKLSIEQIGNTNLNIARIASCGSDGEEVTELPTESLPDVTDDALSLRSSLELHTTSASVVDVIETRNGTTNLCWNGGKKTTAGCACTPGFTGQSCKLGCGRNRFGQDCEGLCSFHSEECQSLLLCNKFTGCQCAPGYHGAGCTQACLAGWYGNDCNQRCGHCAGLSVCDVYTGECASCEDGYLAPHCKLASVYYGSKPDVYSPLYNTIFVSFDPSGFVSQGEPPQLYQIQIREKEDEWKVYTTKYLQKSTDDSEEEKNISEKIGGLKSGIFYQVRILLIDANFQKYQGDLVQAAEILVKCDVPTTYNYKLTAAANTTAVTFFWNYETDGENWCPLEYYEVTWREGWKRHKEFTTKSNFTLSGLVPGLAIKFQVRSKTSGGFAPYSSAIIQSAIQTEQPPVQNLKVVSSQSTSVELLWEPPRGSGDQPLLYTISYKCVERPACSSGCLNVSEGQLTQEGTSITLSPLLPFTKYSVEVKAEGGLSTSIFVGTTKILPSETPVLSSLRPVRTNTSVTVFWDQTPVCTGYLLGYNYQLTKVSDAFKILASGFTKETTASFHNLTASTEYVVKVFVLTVAGWNPQSYLAININTSATVPEAVRNLTVYKRGRGMIGLRWAEPRATYGQLKSFTLTHSLGQDVVSHTVEPSHCAAWPSLYCHTIEGLRSNRRYNITVSARNSEVPEDGELAFVTAITKESTPTALVNLAVTNSSSTSLVLQWEHPDQANGVLRSFVVSIEETEKYDQEGCCQVYPLVETSVKEETQKYEAEVSGLHPASTYYVSVSAKTVGLGPSQSLVAYTSPPSLPLTVLPSVQIPSSEISWLPQDKLPDVNNSDVYTSLVKVHLVIAVVTETPSDSLATGSGISDPKLDNLLQRKIGKPFYFISEYTKDDDVDVLSDPIEDQDSVWGHPVTSLAPGVKYQLAAAQVLEYNGVYSVDIRLSQPFTL